MSINTVSVENRRVGLRLVCWLVVLAIWSVGSVAAWAADKSTTAKATIVSQLSPAQLNDIIDHIERTMTKFAVPGMAVAIVKDDQVVMAKGFGVRQLGQADKVDADTLFGIASNSKAFTAAALAILVDEGRLQWDDKVRTYLPNFKLYDPYVTESFTLRDMLSHRSGLGIGAGDLLIWPHSDISVTEIINKMQYLTPVAEFRDQYAYNNLMYVLAGQVVANVSGKSWADFVRQRILTPLGMTQTRMAYSLIEKTNRNVASPHNDSAGQLQVIGGSFLEQFSSAGAMASNVNDMSRWVRLQLAKGYLGRENGKEKMLFSTEQSINMHSPNTLMTVDDFLIEHDGTHFKAYGLGWSLNDYHGYKMVSHNGGILGMVSRVAMLPELHLGVVILTNQQAGGAFNAVAHDIINRYLGLPAKDWLGLYYAKQQTKAKQDQAAVASLLKERQANSQPTLPLASYAQPYQDPWYGDIDITLNANGQLQLQFSRTAQLLGNLEHYQYNTFIVRWLDRTLNADAFVHFQLNQQAQIERVSLKPLSEETDFSFDFQDLHLTPKSSATLTHQSL